MNADDLDARIREALARRARNVRVRPDVDALVDRAERGERPPPGAGQAVTFLANSTAAAITSSRS